MAFSKKESVAKKEKQTDVDLTSSAKLRRWVHKYNVADREKEGWKKVLPNQQYTDLKSTAVQKIARDSGELVLMEKGE